MNDGALTFAGGPIQAESFSRFERILFTTDFSETSLNVLPAAGAVARTFGSSLTLMYVLTPGDEICAAPEFAPAIRDVVETDANARLLALKYSAQLEGVNANAEVYKGGWNNLIDKIASDNIDLLVLSTHGNQGFRHLLLGSMAEDMTHSVTCPVLTVGPHAKWSTGNEFRPKHILFATDATADSFRVLPYALEFAKAQYANIALLHVLPGGKEESPDADAFAALMRDLLHRKLSLAEIKNISPEIVVKFGNVKDEILNAAQERGSELIVMGARSKTKRGTFSRSVSYGVISSATCPVLTVRGTP